MFGSVMVFEDGGNVFHEEIIGRGGKFPLCVRFSAASLKVLEAFDLV